MASMSCAKLTIWTILAMSLQIAGLFLFVLGFFPVKPALSGISGLESYQSPGTEDFNDTSSMSSHDLRSLFLEQSQVLPLYRRLILMVVDGLPAEFVLGKDGRPPNKDFVDAMPYTQSLLANGRAIGYHAKAAPPTVTMPRLKAMVSGAIGGFLDVAFNFNTQAFLDDNLLGQFFRIGWKMTLFGDETWMKLFPKLFMRQDGVSSFFVKDTVEVDLNVSRHLPEELHWDDWHLMILHYLGVDHVGHIGGRKSVLMPSKLKEMDDVIKLIHLNSSLFNASKDADTLLLVVSDHGMTESGNHGGSSYEESDSLALFIGWNSKVLRHDISIIKDTINQVDIAPTLALLFGVPIPKNNVGVVVSDCLLSLTDGQLLRALELNSWQLLRLLKAQLPGLSCVVSNADFFADARWSNVSQCSGTVEELLCCLYSTAAALHSFWKTTASRADSDHHYDHTVGAYQDFLMTASEWLTRKVTDKPLTQLAFGILAMVLASLIFLRLLFCLQSDECPKENQNFVDLKNRMKNWSLEEFYVVAVVVIFVVSMGSSSMVEEEQYIWHFSTSTLFWILLRRTMKSLPLRGQDRLGKSNYYRGFLQVFLILIMLICGRITRAWHQGGVNWTHLPDISKWLEKAGAYPIKATRVTSGILVTSLSLFGFSRLRTNKLFNNFLQFIYLLSGYLVLRHIIKYQDNVLLASGRNATIMAQIIYAVLSLSTVFTVLASPWLSSVSECNSTLNRQLAGSQSAKIQINHLSRGLKESFYLTGWAYMISWSLLQLLLQKPINSMPVFLLLLEIFVAVIYFSSGACPRPWVEVATLYFIGMAGHFGFGNSNTLATIDVAGAFIGVSNHSTILSGILMFCITYASPLFALLSLIMYISLKDESHYALYHTMDFGALLKSVLAVPFLLPLGINSVLLVAYTVILLQMRNHLFIWSVFSPKYLYVCATTASVYIGIFIVATTVLYISLVYTWRKKKLVSVENNTRS